MKKTSITRMTIEKAKKSEDLTDVERVNSISESEIEANALSDPDNQPLTPNSLKKMRRKEHK
jgi:catabolite regulation protein CreA